LVEAPLDALLLFPDWLPARLAAGVSDEGLSCDDFALAGPDGGAGGGEGGVFASSIISKEFAGPCTLGAGAGAW
jgi:hypothetical protein